MDIEELIKEQKKTQAILENIAKSGTFEKFLENIEEHPDPTRMLIDFTNTDPWDYTERKELEALVIGRLLKEASDKLSLVKGLLRCTDDFYHGHIKQWEGYREYCKQHKKRKNDKYDWTVMYSNPVCLDFFEKYEKEHGITESVAKEAKKELIKRKEKQ